MCPYTIDIYFRWKGFKKPHQQKRLRKIKPFSFSFFFSLAWENRSVAYVLYVHLAESAVVSQVLLLLFSAVILEEAPEV